MTQTSQNLPTEKTGKYVAGDTAVLEVTVEKDDGTTKDVTGANVEFALASYTGQESIVTKSVGNGITIVDGPNGRINVRIEDTDTVALGDANGRDYYYEIEVTDDTGDVATVTTGEWTIYPDTA